MARLGIRLRRTFVMSMLAGAGVALFAAPSRAQLATPSGVHVHTLLPLAPPLGVTGRSHEKSELPGRLGLALVGGAAGGFGGALIGYILPGGGGEDPGLAEMVTSAAIGAALGAAAFAAVPEGLSRCDYSDRFGRGLLGAALGVAVGLLGSRDSRIVALPLGGVIGAALGAESCEWFTAGD